MTSPGWPHPDQVRSNEECCCSSHHLIRQPAHHCTKYVPTGLDPGVSSVPTWVSVSLTQTSWVFKKTKKSSISILSTYYYLCHSLWPGWTCWRAAWPPSSEWSSLSSCWSSQSGDGPQWNCQADISRDSNGISKLPLILLILPYMRSDKISHASSSVHSCRWFFVPRCFRCSMHHFFLIFHHPLFFWRS